MKKVIGIPRALLYYKYFPLWKSFFEYLEYDVLVSDITTTKTIEDGSNYTIDEACLSLKIFAGHVHNLKNKCDYIFIPRIISLKKKEKLCTHFSALYDMIKISFKDEKIIHYNIDDEHHKDEQKAMINLGISLGNSYKDSYHAYINAKKRYKEYRLEKYKSQTKKLSSSKIKILVAGHPYNLYDSLVGNPIINYLKKLGAEIIYSDIYDKSMMNREYKQISKTLYWTYSKEILGAIIHYKDMVDGIIIVSTFPCGTDSLTNEMCVRKIKDTPIITVIVDEQSSATGLYTRLESFMDILERRKIYEQTNN